MPGKYKGSGGTDDRSIYAQRLAALALLAPASYGVEWNHFTGQSNPPGGMTVGGGGGAPAPTRLAGASSRGGVLLLDSGAGAGGQSNVKTFLPITGPVSTDKWGLAARFKCAILPTANARIAWGLYDAAGSQSLMLGAVGPLDGANFVLQHSGNFAGSKIVLAPFDTAYHTFAAVHPGDGKVYAYLDWTLIGSATMTSAPGEGLLWGEVYNNGAAVQFQQHTDWVGLVFTAS
jgi:hypothetical protein